MILLSVSQRTYFNLLIAFLLKEKRLFPFRNQITCITKRLIRKAFIDMY
jgi:hypothetical protein